jgi:hypothetical protein
MGSHQAHKSITVILLLLDSASMVADDVGAELLAHARAEVHDLHVVGRQCRRELW